ncbi:hypothetical protein pEaSNUABM46_00059 [Erwinia phage pEa_SNUABM_46]|nr:hypothetical protein pEaSNUABM45_00059 [Erwinia phage pEa_SNUABM_45]QYW04043.1 hypothetical protein pEaSNUABM46_00059 [Erwinia phage pEa_SNUABM_46]
MVAVEEVLVIKVLLNAIGLRLITKANRRKIEQHHYMMQACTDVYDWCSAEFPQAAEAVEHVRTRALGYEGRSGHNSKIMTPYEAHTGISNWRELMRSKYKDWPPVDFPLEYKKDNEQERR